MRMKGKKVLFNIKDTWSMCDTLSPVICAGIKKFKEVSLDNDNAGLPSSVLWEIYPDSKGEFTNEQLKFAKEEWFVILDKMVYAFENKEPEINDYSFEFIEVDGHGDETDEGHFTWNMLPDNKEVYEQYLADTQCHETKVKEGYMLFGKHLPNLWW